MCIVAVLKYLNINDSLFIIFWWKLNSWKCKCQEIFVRNFIHLGKNKYQADQDVIKNMIVFKLIVIEKVYVFLNLAMDASTKFLIVVSISYNNKNILFMVVFKIIVK